MLVKNICYEYKNKFEDIIHLFNICRQTLTTGGEKLKTKIIKKY